MLETKDLLRICATKLTCGHSWCLTFIERNTKNRHILHLRNKTNTGSFIFVHYDLITETARNPDILHLCKARRDVCKRPTYVTA